MSDNTEDNPSTTISSYDRGPSTAQSIMNPQNLQSMMTFADFMAKGVATIPVHFRGKPSDCLAVVMQAMQWGMLPHVVAQKTFVTPGGIMGYEAQLINAVAVSSGALKTQPDFDFIGDWTKILGKVKEMESNKDGKKSKYYVPGWDKKEEEGLGVKVTATLSGETEPRQITVLLAQCYPRFSTGWALDPQQQITYAAVRKYIRRFAPQSLMGVYAAEELDDSAGRIEPDPEKDIPGESVPENELPFYPDDKFKTNLPKWAKAVEAGKTTKSIIDTVGTMYNFTEEQLAGINSLKAKPVPTEETPASDQEQS
jgi:hypothetical protein